MKKLFFIFVIFPFSVFAGGGGGGGGGVTIGGGHPILEPNDLSYIWDLADFATEVVFPVTISICLFFVILKLARRTLK